MAKEAFRVILDGVKEGIPVADVKRRLASLFKLDESKIGILFQGGPVVIKKDLDSATAEKYRLALDEAGAVCRMEVGELLELSNEDLKRVAEEAHRAEVRVRTEMAVNQPISRSMERNDDKGASGGIPASGAMRIAGNIDQQEKIERSLFVRILIGLLWLIPIYFVTTMIIGGLVGAIAGTSTQGYESGYATGYTASRLFFQKYAPVVFVIQILLTVLLCFFGILPGTAKFKRKKTT